MILCMRVCAERCLHLEGKRDWLLTWQVLDCVVSKVKQLCNYATSVTMPVIDKERTERRDRRQREQCDRAEQLTEKRKKHHREREREKKDVLQRRMKR